MRTMIFSLLILLASFPADAHQAEIGDLVIYHPWSRASAGAAKTGAVFMKIENKSGTADRLIAASSPVADKVEFHTHIVENGVAKMRPVAAIDLPPGATTELKPGGLHVMLIGLRQQLKEYDSFPLTLTFEQAGQLEAEVLVEEAGAEEPAH